MVKELINPNNFYIANQSHGFFDEVQRMALAYHNGQAIAIEGEPGLGKNQAIEAVANAFGLSPYRVRCTEEMMARDIIGGEKLVAQKSLAGIATAQEFVYGPMLKAMAEGNMLILDEVNQLLPTVQKSLNSVLEEGRTLGNIEGDVDIQAQDGFGLFLTYNPATGVDKEDIEKAVVDRCKILNFDKLPIELQVRMALYSTGDFDLDQMMNDQSMSVRAIQANGELKFLEYEDGLWKVYGQDQAVKADDVAPYLFFDATKAARLNFDDAQQRDMYDITRSIVKSLEEVKGLAQNGTGGLRERWNDGNLERVARLNVNPSSPRLIKKLVNDVKELRTHGYSNDVINKEIVQSIIDFSVPAEERNEEFGGDYTLPKIIGRVCNDHTLINSDISRRLAEKDIGTAIEESVGEEIKKAVRKSIGRGMGAVRDQVRSKFVEELQEIGIPYDEARRIVESNLGDN